MISYMNILDTSATDSTTFRFELVINALSKFNISHTIGKQRFTVHMYTLGQWIYF